MGLFVCLWICVGHGGRVVALVLGFLGGVLLGDGATGNWSMMQILFANVAQGRWFCK